jgi:hypothetical protein
MDATGVRRARASDDSRLFDAGAPMLFRKQFLVLGLYFAGIAMPNVAQSQLALVDVWPPINGMNFSVDSPITLQFDRAINPSTLTASNVSVFGRASGASNGSWELSNGNLSATFYPDRPFAAGEVVTIGLSKNLAGLDGAPFRSAGFTTQFWTSSRHIADLDYAPLASMTTGNGSIPYGGAATDLNHDGWTDLTITNEGTADLRVFLNQADGSGKFSPFRQPTYSVGSGASPSEVYDFNGDGHTDIVVSNRVSQTVSVLLGLGNGAFGPQQSISMGGAPRGITVLDVDGDGDADIVNANQSSNDLALMLNNGSGVFSPPTFFDGGVNVEFSLASGDMNNDGISDLVVGSTGDARIRVLLGAGNGSFNLMAAQDAGGPSRMITVGDVNSDGNLDVSTANGNANNAAILFGLGNGTLSPPRIYNVAGMGSGDNRDVIATDLGDLDGDGDLDWVTSSYVGNWVILENDGNGGFDFFQEIDAPWAASCALLLDHDNDGDLDLAMVDEIADVLITQTNIGVAMPDGDYNGNEVVDAADYVVWRKTMGSSLGLAADGNRNGMIDSGDYDVWRANFGGTSASQVSTSGLTVPEASTVAILVELTIAGMSMRHIKSMIR